MKKLLFLLLFPVLTFGQSFNLKHEILEQGPFVVGDTITVKYQLIDNTDTVDARLLQFDIGWDLDKLTRLGTPNWQLTTPDNKSFTHNYWSGYTYVGAPGYDWSELTQQHENGWTYTGGGNEGVARFTIQSVDDIGPELFLQQFTIKDITGTNATDYTDAVRFNWAYLIDSNNVNTYDVFPDPSRELDLNASNSTPAGTVTFQLQTPNAENISDYMIVIETLEQYQSMQESTQQSYNYIQGNFNASAQFITTELKQDTPYIVNVFIAGTYDQENQTNVYPQWLDDVVTVSDVMQTFKQAIGTEPDGTGNVFQYNIQKRLANVDQQGPNDPVDFKDSYALLAHIAGVLDNAADQNNNEAQEFYPITSFANGSMNTSGFFDTFGTPINSQEEWLASRTFTLEDDQPVTFNFAHGLMGDADLSHSTTPNLNADTEISALAKSRRMPNILMAAPQETIDLDIVSELVNGEVVLEINLTKEDLAGMQFNISYDKSILMFKDIIFDTGNTMTNFAKHFDDGRINLGTINIKEENVKTGKPFKLVFVPKVSIQNTAGLVTFKVTDAVKHNGTKVNLNIQ